MAVIGQSGNFAPADKKIYALRDVTATVESIPLIASSIMSKKLASGTDAIVLDVKAGHGAFMKNVEDATTLAEYMVQIGKNLGRKVCAVITDMNRPLGNAIGNALEVREAIEVLSGKIGAGDPLYEVCMLLGEKLLLFGGLAKDEKQARKKLEEAIKNRTGLEKLKNMIHMLGGEDDYISLERIDELCNARRVFDLQAEEDGVVASLNAYDISLATVLLGAGRAQKEDEIDPAVGLVMKVRCGDAVKKGDPLCTLYVNDEKNLKEAVDMIRASIHIADSAEAEYPLIYGVVE